MVPRLVTVCWDLISDSHVAQGADHNPGDDEDPEMTRWLAKLHLLFAAPLIPDGPSVALAFVQWFSVWEPRLRNKRTRHLCPSQKVTQNPLFPASRYRLRDDWFTVIRASGIKHRVLMHPDWSDVRQLPCHFFLNHSLSALK